MGTDQLRASDDRWKSNIILRVLVKSAARIRKRYNPPPWTEGDIAILGLSRIVGTTPLVQDVPELGKTALFSS
jgi:hypothetical protein